MSALTVLQEKALREIAAAGLGGVHKYDGQNLRYHYATTRNLIQRGYIETIWFTTEDGHLEFRLCATNRGRWNAGMPSHLRVVEVPA